MKLDIQRIAEQAQRQVPVSPQEPAPQPVREQPQPQPELPPAEPQPQFDGLPSTGKAAGLLCRRPEDEKYLLLRRAGDQDYQKMWSLPGGGIDEGETAIEAAMREFKEECGVEAPVIHLHGKIVYPGPPVKYTTFLAQLGGTPRIKLDKKEHDKFKWVSYKEAREMDLHPGLSWALNHLEGPGEYAKKVERYGGVQARKLKCGT